jgi:hypothetical protein
VFSDLQKLIEQALAMLAFGFEVFALVDAARTRADAFVAASKQTKPRWLAILGVATALGFVALPVALLGGGKLGPFDMLSIIAVVAAVVYLTDVRPAVRQIRGGGGGSRFGPYGPW